MIRANDLEFLKLKLNINTEDNIEKITRLTGRETILLIYKIISAELPTLSKSFCWLKVLISLKTLDLKIMN